MYPPQSGKYTTLLTTAALAETSPPVVNTHLLLSVEALLTEIVVSDVEAVLAAFWPNMGQDSSCALKEPTAMVPSMIAMAKTLCAVAAVLNVHQLQIVIPFHPF